MAIVRGIHILAHGNKAEAGRIAVDIGRYNRLRVGTTSFYGIGVYAWYEEHLPTNLQDWPQVFFEVDASMIEPVLSRHGVSRGFFRIPGSIGDDVSIHVIRFVNLE